MIRVRDLRVDYDNVCAVRDLDLDIAAGQVFGLIGPNGSGKTSTMRALMGLVDPTYGEIAIGGIDMRERPRDACRIIGFMPDFPPMYDDLKVWEFLDLFAVSYGIPRSQRPEAVDFHLDMVGLLEKRDAFTPQLSRGMRQRLMLAKTLIPDPQVLLLDEPASGLDPHGRADLKKIIKALAEAGKTVLVSSHILAEMSEFCTAVGIMERGRMVVSGKVEEVAEKVMGKAVLVIEVVGGADLLPAVARRDPQAGRPKPVGEGRFEVPYSGDAVAASEFLKLLVAGGVRVSAFGRKKEGLEDLFLKVGARELA
jgi:ABC-2 type transport system ATP-binding protein